MTVPHRAQQAAKLLQLESAERERTVPAGSAADAEARRRGIAAMERALREGARRRRQKRMLGAVFAAVAAAAAIFVIVAFSKRERAEIAQATPVAGVVATTVTGSVRVVHAGASRVALPGAVIEPGDRLYVSPGAGAIMTLTSGSRLAAEAGSEVGVDQATQRHVFLLSAGTLNADVVPLRPGEQFIVRTGDTEVEVRGTSFAVSIVEAASACTPASATRVDVREGVVVVRHGGREQRVSAGEIWPSCPTTPGPSDRHADADAGALGEPPSTAATRALPSGGRVAPRSSARPAPSPAALAAQASALREQNAAFAKAVELRRSGHALEAAAAFEQFLATYPKSVLRESAEVEILRAYRGRDDERARTWAKRYLSNHPAGTARSEAEAIVGGGSR